MRTRAASLARRIAAAGLLAAAAAWAAPSVEVTGWPGPPREAASLLSASLRAPRDSASLARDLVRLSARLQALGYLDGHASGGWSGPDAEPRLIVRIEPGGRSRFAPVAIALPSADSALIAAALEPLAGEPADPARFAAALDRAVEAAESAGHAWAQLSVTEWRADSGLVHTGVTGALGPRVTIRDVRLEGIAVTQPALARRAMGSLEGMPYRPAAARAAADRLMQLGVFQRTEWLGLEGGADWRDAVLVYRVEEPRYNRIEGALGVQGEAGVVGLARFDLGNLLGTGRAVGFDWRRRGRGLSDLEARYREPRVLGWPLSAELALSQQLQDTLYTRDRFGVRGVLAVSARERIEMGYEEERVVQTRSVLRGVDLAHTTFGLTRDGRDDTVSPRRGIRARLAATQIARRERSIDGTRTRSRGSALDAAAEWHRPLGARTGLMAEAVATGRLSGERVLGPFERTPVGGAATLRGHDEEAFRADRVLRTRAEWRWFVAARGERLHAFWDHAEMETREPLTDAAGTRLRRERADGVGFGLRLPAAGGFVDLDYGLEPGRGALDGRIHLRLVTAF